MQMLMLRPTCAILVDSVRALRAKWLFWIVLGLSAIVVLLYGSIGFDEAGVTYFYGLGHIESPYFFDGSPFSSILLEVIFSIFIVNIWLAWGAMILALVSTAGILPDFLADGSIDLILAKPITRARVFLTKYVGSLTFVFVQVLVFCVGIFLILYWRTGDWRLEVFWAVPLLVLMFSYLYSIMALLNIWTRSTLASLLITAVAWMLIGVFNQADTMLTMFKVNSDVAVELYEERIAEEEIARADAEAIEDQHGAEAAEDRIAALELKRVNADDNWEVGNRFYQPVHWISHVMPKTSETVSLLQRWMEADSELGFEDLLMGNFGSGEDDKKNARSQDASFFGDREIRETTTERVYEYVDSRGAFYIIGTSLLFEFFLIGLATFFFARQDF